MKFSFKNYFSTSQRSIYKLPFSKSIIQEFFIVNFEKTFFQKNKENALDISLQYSIIRANLFYLNAWFVINQIRNQNNLKALMKLYYVYQVKREVRQYNRKKIMYLFDDNYNKQVLDELNRSANALFIGLDDYFNDNIMKRDLKELIKQDVLCEKYSEVENVVDKYSNYVIENNKINDFVNYLLNDYDLNKF